MNFRLISHLLWHTLYNFPMSSVTILHNSRAGHASYAGQVERLADDLTHDGLAVRLERRENIDGLRAAAREAAAAGAGAVLVAGGDGTVGAIAGELAGTATALGILPAGTANVLAKTLHIPRPGWGRPSHFTQAARLLLGAPAQLTDLGCANGEHFLVWAGMGLDARVTQVFERQRELSRRVGGFVYNVAVTFVSARDWHGLNLTLRASGPAGAKEVSGHFLMATVCHTGWHGGGLFSFTDDFHLDDGLMDLWAFEGRTYADGLALAAVVFTGRHHHGHPKIHRLTGASFEFEAAEPQTFEVDAEPKPPTRKLSVQVLPRSLRLLVPPSAAAQLYLNPRSNA
jgi:diacylglycerol kinase (ATP)